MINKKLTAKIVLGLMLATPFSYADAAESIGPIQTAGINENSVIITANNDVFVNFIDKGEIIGTSNFAIWAQGTDGNIEEIKLLGNEITINSDSYSHTETRAVWANTNGSITLGNGNSIIKVNATGKKPMAMAAMGTNSKLTVNGSSLIVNCDEPGAFALHVQNNTETAKAPDTAASVDINVDNIVINGNDLGITAFSNGQMNINGNLTVNATNAIDTRGNATININTDGKHTTVLNGDIVFETPNSPGDAQNSGKIINSNVNINLSGEESSWTGRAYQEYKINGVYVDKVELEAPPYHGNVTGFKMSINDGASWNMTGDSFINNVNLTDDGVINMQESATEFNATEIGLNEGIINLQGENQEVNVVTLTGEGGTVNTNSLDNKMSIGTVGKDTAITVNGSGEIADAIYGGDATAQNLADVVTTGTGKSAASQITTDEGIIAGKITADVNADGKITNTVYAKNTTNVGLSNLAAINLMTWRQENNDMNKRLGELRDSKGEHGVWARMVRGEVEYESIKNQYNYYQVGYDEKLSTDPNWTVGMFLTRTEGNSTFRTGSAENNHTGVGVYGSYLKDDGSFIDLVAKYARIDSDFNANGGVGSGDYNTNGYSVSAEYGKRFEQGNGFWIEPQVELTYGTVGAVDYTTSNGAEVRQEGMDSLVGRVGFSLGKDIKAGNVYARASYLYDFDGETEVTMSRGGISDVYEQDLGGGWFEVGVGTNINLSDATHLYFDVEKTYGGDVATPWQWSAGIRYSF
jgi:hypothetical protein